MHTLTYGCMHTHYFVYPLSKQKPLVKDFLYIFFIYIIMMVLCSGEDLRIYILHQDFTIKNIIQASHQNPSLGSTHYWISNALSCLPHMLQFEYAMIIFSVFSCISLRNSMFLFTKAKTSRRAFIRLQKWTRISQHYRSPTCKGYDSLQVATR